MKMTSPTIYLIVVLSLMSSYCTVPVVLRGNASLCKALALQNPGTMLHLPSKSKSLRSPLPMLRVIGHGVHSSKNTNSSSIGSNRNLKHKKKVFDDSGSSLGKKDLNITAGEKNDKEKDKPPKNRCKRKSDSSDGGNGIRKKKNCDTFQPSVIPSTKPSISLGPSSAPTQSPSSSQWPSASANPSTFPSVTPSISFVPSPHETEDEEEEEEEEEVDPTMAPVFSAAPSFSMLPSTSQSPSPSDDGFLFPRPTSIGFNTDIVSNNEDWCFGLLTSASDESFMYDASLFQKFTFATLVEENIFVYSGTSSNIVDHPRVVFNDSDNDKRSRTLGSFVPAKTSLFTSVFSELNMVAGRFAARNTGDFRIELALQNLSGAIAINAYLRILQHDETRGLSGNCDTSVTSSEVLESWSVTQAGEGFSGTFSGSAGDIWELSVAVEEASAAAAITCTIEQVS